jgi:hypothetical protein
LVGWFYVSGAEPERASPVDSNPVSFVRAGEGTRTLDNQLGRLELYQLSYTRSFLKERLLASRASPRHHQLGRLELYHPQFKEQKISEAEAAPWREVDSNHRRHKPADLQSAPFGRSGIPPNIGRS